VLYVGADCFDQGAVKDAPLPFARALSADDLQYSKYLSCMNHDSNRLNLACAKSETTHGIYLPHLFWQETIFGLSKGLYLLCTVLVKQILKQKSQKSHKFKSQHGTTEEL
jgi:hypothetical protein